MISYSPKGVERINNRKLRPMITLSFDDGNESNHSITAPIMESYGLRGSYYIIVDRIGTEDFMTAQQIKDIADAGNEVGSHTVSHPDLRTLTATELKTEYLSSKLQIEAITEKPVRSIAYPYGYGNELSRNLAGAYYESGRGTDHDIIESPYQLWNLDRVRPYGRHDHFNSPAKWGDGRTPAEMIAIIDDFISLDEPSWLTFYMHRMYEDDDSSKPSNRMSRSDFETVVSHLSNLKKAGVVDVVTYIEGSERIYNGKSIYL